MIRRYLKRMELLSRITCRCPQRSCGFKLCQRVLSMAILCILWTEVLGGTFSDQLDQVLRGPSRHGDKVPPWNPDPETKLRIKRALADTTPETGLDEDDFGDELSHRDYEEPECAVQYDFHEIIDISYRGPVCDIIDARNHADTMNDLKNCVVVNGFVHLVFMHDLTEEDLKKYRFPKLRVITHYLLVFRMYNLRTLRYMFPNLAVIGGLELFKDYALVLYENPHMKEIGLGNLQFINRGGVRIQKNPTLCYLSTIDWERLGRYTSNSKLTEGAISLLDNREEDQCVDQCGDNSNCDTVNGRKVCWGLGLCQKKTCPTECPHSCHNGRCVCHEQCLAGCSRPNNPNACTACREKYYNGTCLQECPIGTYLIHGWLCVEKEHCQKRDWCFFGNVCQYQCPVGYEVEVKDCMKICTKCENDCGGVCRGNYLISDVRSIEAVKACREIEGALTININGGSEVVGRLDSALKDLEVIGSLIVQHSFPLITLYFLQNLKRITGRAMEEDIYSVYILENQNLKELWNFTTHKLKIEGGKAFFHFNPKLCMSEVNKVRELTPEEEDDKDISDITNGDKATCKFVPIEVLDVRMFGIQPVVEICWKNIVVKDERTLIGYQVFYKESPQQNAKKNEGVDACQLKSWTIVDKRKSKDPHHDCGPNGTATTTKLISHLKAYTQYAFYIQASTTSTARSGAASEIQYFTTKPSRPTQPKNLYATQTNTSSIEIAWDPPAEPNGNITHYIIEWQRQPEEDLTSVRSVDTCKHSYTKPVKRTPSRKPTIPKIPKDDQGVTESDCRQFLDPDQISKEEAIAAQESTEFENYLQDQIFFPLPPEYMNAEYVEDALHLDDYNMTEIRKRRSIVRRSIGVFVISNSTTAPTLAATSTLSSVNATTATPEDLSFMRRRMVVEGTTATLTGLHHYAEYSVQVYACNHASNPRSWKPDYIPREYSPSDTRYKNYTECSIEAIIMKRTSPNKSVDIIPPGTLKQFSENQGTPEEFTRLYWEMPVDPNAYVRTFTIEVNSTDTNIKSSETFCVHVNISVAHAMTYDFSHSSRLTPGSYSARIRPISLAGEGNWTEPISFEISDTTKEGTVVLTVVLVVIVVLVLILILGLVFYIKTRKKAEDHSFIPTDFNPDYAQVYMPDEYEIEIEKVSILEEIGHGNFGKVFSGIAKGIVKGQEETQVAIKKLHENAMPSKRFEFLKEASMMKAFNAHHVVRLLGVVSQTMDPMVIMEFMAKGDLKSYLRSRRESSEENSQYPPAPTLQDKLQMAAEIADGMAYLAAYKFVHRDLAARNCLVNEHETVKIGDFGLTRDIYETDYYRKESRGFLPIRWMAPESLKDGVFDSRSDVWSYGVVLWELATLAEQPYQGQQHDQVTRYVIDGGYMERPRNCPKRLYDLMTVCWQYNPNMRPTFIEIVQELYNDVNDEFKEVCFYGKHGEVGSGEDEEVHLLQHDRPNGAEFLYPHNDLGGGVPLESSYPEVVQQNRSAGDNVFKVMKNNTKPNRLSSTPPRPEVEEKVGLLAPESTPIHGQDYPGSGDSRSPNTTSTTALTSPSSGEGQNQSNRRSRESLYENDYEDRLQAPQTGGAEKDNSRTYKPSRLLNTYDKEPVVSYKHLNGGLKKRKTKDFDLESGVDEGMWEWGYSPHSSIPSTPTEKQPMLSANDPGDISMYAVRTASSNC